jgi:hypothetical protein
VELILTSVGAASTALIFDLYIPQDSYLRDLSITDPIITESEIQQNIILKYRILVLVMELLH